LEYYLTMPIGVNGSGTITGISVGGLPDGIVDTDMLAANAVTAAKSSGRKILQVVQELKTDTASANVDAGGESSQFMTANITPSATSSKILVMISATIGNNWATNAGLRLRINGSTPAEGVGVGMDDGNRRRVSSSAYIADSDARATLTMTYLHSPNSTSSQSYGFTTLHWQNDQRIMYINRSHGDGNHTYVHRAISTVTLMEIGA
jgi:hypothetical protein